MPTTEQCGTPSPCLLPPPPTRRRPPLRSPPRRCHCTARREHAASRSRVHQDIHPLGGQASIVQRRKRQDPPRRRHRFCGRGRGGRLTVRRGCSSPERTFRPLDVRVESASRLMSSSPRRLCERERAGRGTIEDAAAAVFLLRAAADAAERRRHGRTGGPVPPPAGLANTLEAAAALRWTLGPTARGRRLRMRAAATTTAPLPPRRGDYNYTEISPTIEASQETCEKLKYMSWPSLPQEYTALQ